MDKVASFAGFDTLFNINPFYDAVGKIGKRYDVDEDTAKNEFKKIEKELMSDDYQKYSALIEAALNKTAKNLGFKVSPSDFSDLLIAHTATIRPFPDAPTALYEAKRKGYKTVLMTNHSRDLIGANIINLDHEFDLVVTSEDVEAYKPNKKFFDYVEQQLGKTEKHVHIAVDQVKDLDPARRQGWETITINRDDVLADGTVESLVDAVEALG
ncbi:HAD-IA family hydrolase [Pediococcus claussenii]|uniref:HAD hydrolase, IA, variant 1 family protein n=1 Tax=Pediococcus claussenii (strain ATCC BAA-344 / DSM 14800 / JCM 18046 / KCTC 3811 / LMG 21948 / P06) TaxID=701521 RepID=G8PAE2_PEDCP|nr:HAD-IA family hydrolase [Pediococcus claussenii]AEV95731.1 HAD hydrolase, IA, variant 1 family protein [Pediococcus claussenii ATCC BAA-344]ANZ69240.1 haloacid dehalogenase [Pediococcus claussenii]ANZ71059.1 haloacid dehalogenase [Pediococcus claussenii]